MRDFNLTDKEFDQIRKLVIEHTGISLSDAKRNLVYGRLTKRLRKMKIDNFGSYISLLKSPAGEDELANFTNAITTNLTSFFRENHHFDFLKSDVLPGLLKRNAATKRIRVWSAGCSTGEEPYSIAMTIRESIPESKDWDIKILATDLDTNVLAHAAAGVYSLEKTNNLEKPRLKRWFMRGKGDQSDAIKVRSELQQMVTFRQLNLMHEWPMRNQFDIIFCRNVVIYFDKPTQKILFARYHNALDAAGHMFIGHSETMFKVSDDFNLIGNTTYTKK
ncbi:MAG: protein-glutamate O-methyltransferase [Sulfuriflexus sp.]|nr:protein-glutamate O-methyltransferase [Sulfuriflexus sp.]